MNIEESLEIKDQNQVQNQFIKSTSQDVVKKTSAKKAE